MAREQNDHSANRGQNAASNQQPTQNVDMHVHVVFGSCRCGRRCGRHGGGGHLLSAFTAKSCVRLDLTAALGTKHSSSSLLQANGSVSRTDRELRPAAADFAADHSIAI